MPAHAHLLIALLLAGLAAAEDANPWRTDLDAAIDQARSGSGRPLAVLVSHPTCSWCKRMIAESADAEAVRRACADVVPVVLDAAERPELSALAGVDSFPTLILINRSGHEVRRIAGYLPPNDLATALRVLALNGDTQGGAVSMLAEKIDPEALAATADGRATLVGLLGLGAPARRIGVRRALAARPEARVLLWPLLTDRRLSVRADATAILAGADGGTRGYDPFAAPDQRAAAAARWQAADGQRSVP